MNYIISLGGSLIVPDKIDTGFLKKFRRLILQESKKGQKFLILTGGGRTCRMYQQAAREVSKVSNDALDWIGIETCALNAVLLRALFSSFYHSSRPGLSIPLLPEEGLGEVGGVRGPVTVASGGLKPGASSDSTSVYYAQKLGIKTILNLTNVAGVFDRDPKKFKKARLIPRMTWQEFGAQFGNKRKPGQHKPFDPSAAKLAARLGIKVVIMDGRDMTNLKRFLNGKDFKGTTVE